MDKISENRVHCSLSNSPEEQSPQLLRGLNSKLCQSGSEGFIVQLLLRGLGGGGCTSCVTPNKTDRLPTLWFQTGTQHARCTGVTQQFPMSSPDTRHHIQAIFLVPSDVLENFIRFLQHSDEPNANRTSVKNIVLYNTYRGSE